MKHYIFLFLLLIFNSSLNGQWEILNKGQFVRSIDFVNDDIGWIAGSDKLLKTEDGGESWYSIPIDEDWSIQRIEFINDTLGWGDARIDGEYKGIKSVDGGQTWKIQGPSYTNFYTGDESVIYAVNYGIMKSTDGGHTWDEVEGDYLDEENLKSAWFFNPDSGIVAGGAWDGIGILLKTFDGGNSWEIITDSTITKFSNLQFINDSTGYFLALNENQESTICFTSDACNSWTTITESHLYVMSFYIIDNYKICAVISDSLERDQVMVSNDGGKTWEKKDLPSQKKERLGWIWQDLYFVSPNLGFVNSQIYITLHHFIGQIVYKTTDGGNNWIIQQIRYPFKDVFFTDNDIGFVSGGATNKYGGASGRLFKTYDGGRTWLNSFHSYGEIKSVFFIDSFVGFILSTHNSDGTLTNIQKTTNSGSTWDEVYADESDSVGFYFAGKDMYFINENIGWIAGAGFHNDTSGAAFLNTTDGGKSWDVSWIFLDTEDHNYAINSMHFADSTKGWAVGESGLIVKQTEQDQWQAQTKVTDSPLNDVFFSDENHGWIAGGSFNKDSVNLKLLKTENGGQSWQEKSNGIFQINDMFFADSLQGWAVGNDASESGMILETTDGGENWTTQLEDLSAPLNAIYFKDGFGWAVGEKGYVLKTNDGATWIDEKNNIVYPDKFELSQNYPNPFNPTTTISYQLQKQSNVELNIYNLLGQKVTTLVSKKQPAGNYKIEWDASGFASGVYLYKLSTDQGFTKIKKLILLK